MYIGVVALLTGCVTGDNGTDAYGAHMTWDVPHLDDGDLAYRSTYSTPFEGVWIPAARSWAVGGISGFTCQLSYEQGAIGADLDFFGGQEHVFDGLDGEVPSVLVGNGETIEIVTFPWSSQAGAWTVPDPVEARVGADGVVIALANNPGCVIEWLGMPHVSSVGLAASFCEGRPGFDVDRDSQTVWVAAGDLVTATPGGSVTTIATDVDFVAWDAVAGALYVARDGGTQVRALAPDGSSLWVADTTGPVRGLDDLGLESAVVVSVDRAEGSVLLVLDGGTGAPLGDQGFDHAGGRIRTSADGATVMLSGREQADFFTRGEGVAGL